MSEVSSDDHPERHGSAATIDAESAQYDLETPEHYELPSLSHVMEEVHTYTSHPSISARLSSPNTLNRTPRTGTTWHMLDVFSYNVNKMESKVRELATYAQGFESKTRPTLLMVQDPPYHVQVVHLKKYYLRYSVPRGRGNSLGSAHRIPHGGLRYQKISKTQDKARSSATYIQETQGKAKFSASSTLNTTTPLDTSTVSALSRTSSSPFSLRCRQSPRRERL
ncbi:hypothetical protein CKAH01_09404 [Colletotrichum kahawae]|uniref:Uncharacterized protein n=1 Tax=Colletotrichum kahawae TaxID=34407 RepID=A0AAD9Y047_COLKA|nr:hypothetical protein CKAH01_09404 [Colletotrichum kahawae]